MSLTDYHAKYIAFELTRRFPSDNPERLAGAVASAQVDLNPHQVDAALFAFARLAASFDHNAKGRALLKALGVAFAKAKTLGAPEKAIIFTESRRTQSYLLRLLADSPHSEGIVLFNGSNTDERSRHIYAQWFERHQGTDRVTGSRTADMRSALVDYFRDQGRIMIATEAGAEGINLQFCIAAIYQRCRRPEEIQNAFDQLQLELSFEIDTSMARTRAQLLENFDDEVREKLRVREETAKASLTRYERLLMQLTRHELTDAAEFLGDATFRLHRAPPDAGTAIPLGLYELPRRSGEAHPLPSQPPPGRGPAR